MRAWLYGRRDTTTREIEEDGCPACLYAHGHITDEPGVAFIEVEGEGMFRVEQLSETGEVPSTYHCERIDKGRADRELLARCDA